MALSPLIEQGRAALDVPKKGEIVRIYYLSEGGELLCTDTPIITRQAADQLEIHLSAKRSDCVAFERWKAEDYWGKDNPAPPLRPGARLVVLPSQGSQTGLATSKT